MSIYRASTGFFCLLTAISHSFLSLVENIVHRCLSVCIVYLFILFLFTQLQATPTVSAGLKVDTTDRQQSTSYPKPVEQTLKARTPPNASQNFSRSKVVKGRLYRFAFSDLFISKTLCTSILSVFTLHAVRSHTHQQTLCVPIHPSGEKTNKRRSATSVPRGLACIHCPCVTYFYDFTLCHYR